MRLQLVGFFYKTFRPVYKGTCHLYSITSIFLNLHSRKLSRRKKLYLYKINCQVALLDSFFSRSTLLTLFRHMTLHHNYTAFQHQFFTLQTILLQTKKILFIIVTSPLLTFVIEPLFAFKLNYCLITFYCLFVFAGIISNFSKGNRLGNIRDISLSSSPGVSSFTKILSLILCIVFNLHCAF